jgi:glucosylceramidase
VLRLLDNQVWTGPFQLHGNRYTFAAGDTIKLELLGQDGPYYRASNGTFTVQVSNLIVSLPTTGPWYNVINEASGLCVDATGWGTTNGTTVQQWACGNQQSNQEWQFQPTGSGYNAVANRNAAAQNLVWDLTGGPSATADGVKIQLWAYGGGTNQQWQQVSLGNGYYEFVARNSGKCLDVPGASTANGVQLQQSTCNGNPQQAFRLAQQP